MKVKLKDELRVYCNCIRDKMNSYQGDTSRPIDVKDFRRLCHEMCDQNDREALSFDLSFATNALQLTKSRLPHEILMMMLNQLAKNMTIDRLKKDIEDFYDMIELYVNDPTLDDLGSAVMAVIKAMPASCNAFKDKKALRLHTDACKRLLHDLYERFEKGWLHEPTV